MFLALSLSQNHNLNKILKKLLLAFLITYIISMYVYHYYADVKYWNVPLNYTEEYGNKLTFNDIFYFLIISFFTIGYGDFTPKHDILKSITILNSSLAFIIILF
jgi:hypothetical protein